jgi:hypothetical protein
MKHMAYGFLWRRCGNSERGVKNLGQSTVQKWRPQEVIAHKKDLISPTIFSWVKTKKEIAAKVVF